MRITHTILIAAAALALGACEKTTPDTATPDDATAPVPATDDLDADPTDELGGDEEATEEATEEPAEGDAEAPTAEE